MKSRIVIDRRVPSPLLSWLGLAAILILSTVLRFQAIHWGLPTTGRFTTLYIDEYTCLRVLSQMNPSHSQFNPHYFIDPTFFYYQVGVLIKIAAILKRVVLTGNQLFYLQNPGEYAKLYVVGRGLTAFYGVLTTALLFWLGIEVTGSRLGGFLTALFYAVVPIAVVSCHVIDVGVPVSFWMAVSFICFIEACRNPGTHRLPLFAGFFAAGLAFSTKYTAAPIFLSGALCLHFCGPSLKTIAGAAGSAIAGFVLGTPYSLLDFHAFKPQFLNAMVQASHSLPKVSWTHFIYPFYHYPYTVGLLLSLVCVMGLLRAASNRTPAAALALAYLIPFFFLMGKSNRHLARYVNETLPFLLPFGALWIASFLKDRSAIWKMLGTLLLVGSLSSVGYTLALNHTLAYETDPRDQASAWIDAKLPPGTSIGVDNDTAEFIHPGQVYMQFWKGKRYPAEAVAGPALNVVGWDYTHSRWMGPAPDYWVDSHYFFEYTEKDADARARNAANLVSLRRGYHPVADFERHIHCGPFVYPFPSKPGFDWHHFFPHLTIYQKDGLH